MGIISCMGEDYTAPEIDIQSDSSATNLIDDEIPTGQTIKSYLNSNLVEGDITVSSGFTLEHKKIKKYMRVVSVEYKGSITPSSTGWFTIGNIANSAMRPVNQFDIFAVDNNSSTSALGCQVRISTDGDIKVYSFAANKALRPIILATYIV